MYDLIRGITAMVLSTISLLAALAILWHIKKHNSLKQIRIITLIIIFCSLCGIASGFFDTLVEVDNKSDIENIIFASIAAGSNILIELVRFCIVWLISFKFWDTMRQLSQYVRITNSTSSSSDSNRSKRETNHQSYSLWKWLVIMAAILISIVNMIFHLMEINYDARN